MSAIATPESRAASIPAFEAPAAAASTGRSIVWIEVGRVLAVIAVIAIHVVSPLTSRTGHPESWWVGNVVDSSARWCVPVFVMLSGALLLGSPRTTDAVTFYRRRLVRLGIPMGFWSVAYLVFGHIVDGVPATAPDALRLVAFGRPYFHLYFLFIVVGLTVAAPLLRAAVERLTTPQLLGAVAIAYGLAIVDNALATLAGIGTSNAITRWIPFVGDFLAGYALVAVAPNPSRVRAVIAVAVAGMTATALGTAILTDPSVLGLGRGRYLYEYHSLTTVPVSVTVFLVLVWSGPWLARSITGTGWRIVATLGAASFGIYLLHPMILVGLGELGISATAMFAPVAVLLAVVLTFTITAAVVIPSRRMAAGRALL